MCQLRLVRGDRAELSGGKGSAGAGKKDSKSLLLIREIREKFKRRRRELGAR